ncbi:hypothetical protein G7Y89_g12605 [Cudoniella acicularis]|uniref:LD-carboxypeptidase n=1 Tax=Cudoniella acicularis TaxID=354080 RepID=A0A8H4R8V2_9HELO|nr:hypothetical protein G7Y89_g12605 [Cudoniella acicularis]
MTTSIIPKALKPGDTIAFISPSERLNDRFPSAITRAQTFFEQQGYHVRNIYTSPLSTNYKESLLQRASEFHVAFQDPTIKAVLCTVGGVSASSLLPYINFDIVKQNPKIFCGYSDITVLHHAISTQTGLRTFYGPTALTEFGDWPKPDEFSSEHFLKVVTGHGTGAVPRGVKWTTELSTFFKGNAYDETERAMKANAGWKWIRKGKAEGPITGGCISVLLRLPGTKFWPDFTGKILLLESAMGEAIASPLRLVGLRAGWLI